MHVTREDWQYFSMWFTTTWIPLTICGNLMATTTIALTQAIQPRVEEFTSVQLIQVSVGAPTMIPPTSNDFSLRTLRCGSRNTMSTASALIQQSTSVRAG